jgi:hypothetical protein
MACCGALIELAQHHSKIECDEITEEQLIQYLGGVPEPRRYCATLAIAALRDALNRGGFDGSCSKESSK